VWQHVDAVLRDPALTRAEVERRRNAGPDPTLVAELEIARRQSTEVEQQLDRLVQALADGSFPFEVVRRKSEERQKERARLQARIRELEGRLQEDQGLQAGLEALETYCPRVASRLATRSASTSGAWR
jgi:chromosome segregation ATPase